MANNESTNLRVSCDTGFADLPPGDFLPPRDPFNQQDVFGAQIFKIAASRDAHGFVGHRREAAPERSAGGGHLR